MEDIQQITNESLSHQENSFLMRLKKKGNLVETKILVFNGSKKENTTKIIPLINDPKEAFQSHHSTQECSR
jgi:hypothetical protein